MAVWGDDTGRFDFVSGLKIDNPYMAITQAIANNKQMDALFSIHIKLPPGLKGSKP